MAILLLELVIVAAFVLVFDSVTLEGGGYLYSLIGAMLSLWELGNLVVASAGAAISTSVIVTIGFDGAAFTTYTVGGSPFLVALALLTVFSSLVLYDTVMGGGRKR